MLLFISSAQGHASSPYDFINPPYLQRNACLCISTLPGPGTNTEESKIPMVSIPASLKLILSRHAYVVHTRCTGTHESSRALRLITKDGLPGTAKKSISPSGVVSNSGHAAAVPMQDKPGSLKETLTKLSPRDGIEQGKQRSQPPSDLSRPWVVRKGRVKVQEWFTSCD